MTQRSLRHTQRGFTLVEIAVVLVIIGLLLGGVLKGQELINSAKVKSLVQEFNSVSTMVYGYQDRFRFLPGDDPRAEDHVGGTKASSTNTGDGRINGAWNTTTEGDESYVLWQHVRLAGLASGTTTIGDAASGYPELNVENGRIGVSSENPSSDSTAKFPAQFYICSGGLSTRFARQIDTTMDDGVTDSGSVRTLDKDGKFVKLTAAAEGDGALYTVCAAY